MNYDDFLDYNPAIVIIVTILLVTIPLFAIIYTKENFKCYQIGKKTKIETQYSFVVGCYIKFGDQFIPYDKWIYNTGK